MPDKLSAGAVIAIESSSACVVYRVVAVVVAEVTRSVKAAAVAAAAVVTLQSARLEPIFQRFRMHLWLHLCNLKMLGSALFAIVKSKLFFVQLTGMLDFDATTNQQPTTTQKQLITNAQQSTYIILTSFALVVVVVPAI
jgi:hypothetical protein